MEKLLGAAHAYLWGSSLISRHDVKQWPHFAKELLRQSESRRASPGRRIWAMLSSEPRTAVREIASTGHSYPFLSGAVADALSELLMRRDFYRASDWDGVPLPAQAQRLL